MERDELVKTLKIVVILAVIMGAIGAVFYLVYGFTILWQAMAAGIITGFLVLLVFILLVLAIYFYLKLFLIRRELKKCREELLIARKSRNSDDESE
ncbi:MAG: hypothetical protein HVN35_03620 [Methanobacteriaceae archaeon]|nr:hypothetical protein [Methanobacteriaceae archaeon]